MHLLERLHFCSSLSFGFDSSDPIVYVFFFIHNIIIFIEYPLCMIDKDKIHHSMLLLLLVICAGGMILFLFTFLISRGCAKLSRVIVVFLFVLL